MAGLKDKISGAPELPGVYLFKDRRGRIIYVGKARDLRDRLRSYILPQAEPRRQALMRAAQEIDWVITRSEAEALILEENLIKLNHPKYNVRLKDDKKYPYLKLTVNEPYPRIFPTRNLKPDGSLLFGPYTSMKGLKRAIKGVTKVFKVRSCKRRLPSDRPERPCLGFHMERCLAPCQGKVSEAEYQELVSEVVNFLSGRSDRLERELEQRMWAAAREENFERASHLRDQLLALREVRRHQPVVLADKVARDVIGLARSDTTAVASLFRVREGKLVGKENYNLAITRLAQPPEILAGLLRAIYAYTHDLPQEILVPVEPEDGEAFIRWAKEYRNWGIRVYTPRRGEKRRCLELVGRNAEVQLLEYTGVPKLAHSVQELQKYLAMERPPRVIEGIDISNIGGKMATGSIVVFDNGAPKPSEYRRFKVKGVSGPDDFAMIEEVLSRRFKRLLEEGRRFPDLILIDGGKGQLTAAIRALKGVEAPPLVLAFAKRTDQLFLVDGRQVSIPGSSPALKLLRRIRNESHRFALAFHRRIRSKRLKESAIEELPGIGPARRLALIRHFGSLERVRRASIEELKEVPGIGGELAERIYNLFHP